MTIRKETRFGTFDELMDGVAAPLVEIATTLRELIFSLHPEAVEVARLGDNAATYGVGPKKVSESYCYIMPNRAWVNLGFHFGSLLEDPNGLLEGTGKKMRHVKVRSLEAARSEALRQLIITAIAERNTALGR